MKKILSAVIFVLAGCAPVTPVTGTQVINIYTTPAAQPWLAEVFACAPPEVALRITETPATADLSLRLGEPPLWQSPMYRIGTEEILVLAHSQNPAQELTIESTRALFAGRGETSNQVWVFSPGEDAQIFFERAVMAGEPVTSLARMAVSPQHMSEILANTPNTIGLLPRRWQVENVHTVYSIPDIPVLALVKDEPQGALQELLACLQP